MRHLDETMRHNGALIHRNDATFYQNDRPLRRIDRLTCENHATLDRYNASADRNDK